MKRANIMSALVERLVSANSAESFDRLKVAVSPSLIAC